MKTVQKQLISQLLKKYSEKIGTEDSIAYVAERNGMLAACQELLRFIDNKHSGTAQWLQMECSRNHVDYHSFLQETRQVTQLFKPRQNSEDHYSTLGLVAGANREEIKLAYRRLSKKYHPDMANPAEGDAQERFVEINKAYHTLLEQHSASQNSDGEQETIHWNKRKKRAVSNPQKKQFFKWAFGLLAAFVVLSLFASHSFRKRAMLTGLREAKLQSPPITQIKPQKAQPVDLPENKVVLDRPREPLEKFNLPKKEKTPESPAQATGSPENTPEIIPVLEQQLVKEQIIAEPQKNSSRAIPAPPDKPVVDKEPDKKETPPSAPDQQEPEAQETPPKTSHTVVLQSAADTRVEAAKKNKEKQQSTDIQTEVNDFFQNYIEAYEQRNLILFARFFEADATENGVPFKDGMSDYSELFAKTSEISLRIDQQPFSNKGDFINIEGRFSIHLHYNNGHLYDGAGPIHFLLARHNDELLIKDMRYSFEK